MNGLTFPHSSSNAHRAFRLPELLQADANYSFVERRHNWFPLFIKKAKTDVTDGPCFADGGKFFLRENIPAAGE